MRAYKLSRFTLTRKIVYNATLWRALHSTLTNAFALVPDKQWRAFKRDFDRSCQNELVEPLVQNGFLIPASVDETALLDFYKQQLIHHNRILKSTVIVTDDCIFRCLYCYPGQKPGRMTHETARQMDAFYIKRIAEQQPRKVMDEFSGGEPLLNLGLVLAVAARPRLYCQGRGIACQWRIITNGALLKKAAVAKMTAEGLAEIRVSLAGPQAIHDELRPFKSGKGSFKTIIGNLKEIDKRIKIYIECQYDPGAVNWRQVPTVLDELAAEGIRIAGIDFTPIMARPNEKRFTAGPGEYSIYDYLLIEAQKRGYEMFAQPPANHCRTDLRNCLVFNVRGQIVSCPAKSDQFAYGDVWDGIDFVKESQICPPNAPKNALLRPAAAVRADW